MQQAQVTDPHSLSQDCKEQRPDLRTPDAALLCKGVTQIRWQVAHHVCIFGHQVLASLLGRLEAHQQDLANQPWVVRHLVVHRLGMT